MVKPSTQRILDRRKPHRIVIFRQGTHKIRSTEQLSLGNGKVMDFKLVKLDEAFWELKEIESVNKCES